MRTRTLKTTILLSFMTVILFLGVSAGTLGFYLIKSNVIDRAQDQVTDDLKAAASVFNEEIKDIGQALSLVDPGADPVWIKSKAELHYVYSLTAEEAGKSANLLARKAAEGLPSGGVRILAGAGPKPGIEPGEGIRILYTPKARPSSRKVLKDLMVKEYAVPVEDTEGKIEQVMVGGRIINRDYELVDKIRDLVFEEKIYEDRPVGTVTIFQDDVRVATNVLNAEGERAIGTRVSEEVYDNVVKNGRTWLDRAFVVNDWYITGYEPIRNPEGAIIGILYVGVLEKPFHDIARNSLLLYMLIVSGAVVMAIFLSVLLAGVISRPVKDMLKATEKISAGDLKCRVRPHTAITELNKLSASFNNMARKLSESYGELKVSNRKLEALNKSYLDLIGFVSHELKGILSSAILNVYSVRDGFLGMVNFKQQKALDSIGRNLDHLDSTVKNFLSLSRIEKGEIKVDKVPLKIKEDIFDVSVDTFAKRISAKEIEVAIDIPEAMEVEADEDLMRVVANNLISNAIKYGKKNGKIQVKAVRRPEGGAEVSVYNDGRPITPQEKKRLFKRFSRLEGEEVKKEKGTGLGLFITREIIESHGGSIDVFPGDKGNTFVFTI
ncbi:MAG: HAMP domain-containing protein [Candidatus Omnitrophica bacterium]|nr:HAMP domain-containing protein [Candidatus Omnitrophota bacterium]